MIVDTTQCAKAQTSPERCNTRRAPQPGSNGIQKVASRNRITAATAVVLVIPAEVSPAIKVASTAPIPPGVGATEDTTEPTR